PAVVSAAFILSSFAVGTENATAYSAGNAGYGLGTGALIINCLTHHEPWAAVALTPSLIGGAVGATYRYFENKFNNILAQPNTIAYLFSFCTTAFTVDAVVFKTSPLLGPGLCWLLGSGTGMFLPRDDQVQRASPALCVGAGSALQIQEARLEQT